MVTAGGSGCGSDLAVEDTSGWGNEVVGDTVGLAPNGSPELNGNDELLVPFSMVGEIGESGNGVCVGEGVASAAGNGVEAFVDIGVLSSVDGFDTSPIPKDSEARSLSSNRERGLSGSYTPPLVVLVLPARAGLYERCACNDLRIFESAESAN